MQTKATSGVEDLRKTIRSLFSRSVLKPFGCVGVLLCLHHLNGHNVIVVYIINVFKESNMR